jgi:hypothetical protein
MIQKKWILLFVIAGLSLAIKAQNLQKADKKELKKATKSLSYEDYLDAFEIYNELYKKYPNNVDVKFGYAVCKLHQKGKESQALPLLEQISSTKNLENFYYHIGVAYLWQGQFENAINSFQTVLIDSKRTIAEVDVLDQLNNSYASIELMKAQRNVEIINLGKVINSEYQESSPVVLPDEKGMFYTSRSPLSNTEHTTDHLNDNFQEVFYAQKKDNKWTNATNLSAINSPLHDASVSVNTNGSLFLFFKTNPNKVSGGDIYQANCLETGEMTGIKKLGPNINTEYIESSACLTPGDHAMYFSSNRPGGYGGFDIYKCNKLPNGEWALPINLGPVINSKGNETAPFVHADGRTMYFSSNGLYGLGGYDVFETKLSKDNYWKKPINLGYPINTKNHDMYFSITADSRKAYFSSDREGGYGGDDIYEINLLDHDSFKTVVRGNTTDDELGTVIPAKITLINNVNKNLNGIYRSNPNNGKFIIIVQPLQTYQFIIESLGYETKILDFSFEELSDMANMNVKLAKTK